MEDMENQELEVTIDDAEQKARTPFEEFLYHQRRALEETGKALEALLPEGFRVHGSNASKEFVRGFKVLVNATMQELRKARRSTQDDAEGTDEAQDNEPPVSTTGKTKVKVRVE